MGSRWRTAAKHPFGVNSVGELTDCGNAAAVSGSPRCMLGRTQHVIMFACVSSSRALSARQQAASSVARPDRKRKQKQNQKSMMASGAVCESRRARRRERCAFERCAPVGSSRSVTARLQFLSGVLSRRNRKNDNGRCHCTRPYCNMAQVALSRCAKASGARESDEPRVRNALAASEFAPWLLHFSLFLAAHGVQ